MEYPNEEVRGENFPSFEQLCDLNVQTVVWLDEHGSYVEDVMPHENLLSSSDGVALQGLPVTDGLPRKQYIVPGDIVERYSPEAAQELELGKQFEVYSWLPHYVGLVTLEDGASTGNYELKPPMIEFSIEKSSSAVLTRDSLTIEFDEVSGVWITDRMSESRIQEARGLIGKEEQEEFASEEQRKMAALLRYGAGYLLAQQLGINRMTLREFEAIQDIMQNLDAMKAEIDRSVESGQ